MSKIYILLGNPDSDGTLGNELARQYESEAVAAGHEVRRTNTGDLQFDPILHKGYKVIQQLDLNHSGQFTAFDGKPIPW